MRSKDKGRSWSQHKKQLVGGTILGASGGFGAGTLAGMALTRVPPIARSKLLSVRTMQLAPILGTLGGAYAMRNALVTYPSNRGRREATEAAWQSLMEGRFSKYGRGLYRRVVQEKQKRQALHRARKNLHAASEAGRSSAFGDYIGAKKDLVNALKRKQLMQVEGGKSNAVRFMTGKHAHRGNQIRREATRATSDLVGTTSMNSPASNSAHNTKVVQRVAKRMGTPARFEPDLKKATTPHQYELMQKTNPDAGEYGLSTPSKQTVHIGKGRRMSPMIAAHEVGHIKSPTAPKVEALQKAMASHLPKAMQGDPVATKHLKSLNTQGIPIGMHEETSATGGAMKSLYMNRRHRKALATALGTYEQQIGNHYAGGYMSTGRLKTVMRNHIANKRAAFEGRRRLESTDVVWQNLIG